MKNESNCPEWLDRARALWPSRGAAVGLDKNWSPKWIKRFIVYLEKPNGRRALKTEKSYRVWLGRFRKWWGVQRVGSVALVSREQVGEE